jgi:hypothetical protein
LSCGQTIIQRFVRLPVEQIAYVRAIVEAHEGLALVRSAEADSGELELAAPAGLVDELDELIAALGLRPIAPPPDWAARCARSGA